jgi:hypothetical protein
MNVNCTKWDQSSWSIEQKIQWQNKCFELGYTWRAVRAVWKNANFFYLRDGKISYSDGLNFVPNHPSVEMVWSDMFPEECKSIDIFNTILTHKGYDAFTGVCYSKILENISTTKSEVQELKEARRVLDLWIAEAEKR